MDDSINLYDLDNRLINVETASIWYYTSNATANHTLNIRYSSTVSLNTALAVGDAITGNKS